MAELMPANPYDLCQGEDVTYCDTCDGLAVWRDLYGDGQLCARCLDDAKADEREDG